MAKYRVNLCLVSNAAGEIPEFEQRFPKSLAAYWWDMEFDASSLLNLADQINAQILADCKTDIETDVGAGPANVIAFNDRVWNPLGGGQHEYAKVLIRVDYGHEDIRDWVFRTAGHGEVEMWAGARFYRKDR